MKNLKHLKSLFGAASTLALALLTGAASAQSSITIFGVVDEAFRSASTQGQGHINQLVSGAYSGARYGFKGREDLGGGLEASFWLESHLSDDTGVISPVGFQRRSTVSLSDRHYGELRLGRDYTPTHTNWARFDPFAYVGIASTQLFALATAGNTPATVAFGTAPNPIQRSNNGLQYLLPRNDWGVEGGLVHNFGENSTAANDEHQSNGGRLGVKLGDFFVQAATLQTRDDKTVGLFKDSDIAGSYETDAVKVSAGLRRFTYLDVRQNTYLLAAIVPFGAVQELKFAWNRAAFGGSVGKTNLGADRADQFGLGYVYHLSKSTHLYATVATILDKGNAKFVIPGAPAGLSGAHSRGFEAGINHEF